MEFKLKIKDIGDNGRITTIGEKLVYNMDGKVSASEWVREPLIEKTFDAPQLTGPIKYKNDGIGRMCKGALGYMHNNANNVYFNTTLVGLYSSPFSSAHGFSVTETNFWRCIALFAARKLIAPSWINQKDEYMVPNTYHIDYQQWLNDVVIYSIFNFHSNQSSLRQIEYKGKKWDIYNNFFFMSIADIEQLAIKHNNNEVFNDCKSHPPDRFVYQQLQGLTLSSDAQKVLDIARELVEKSFSLRNACQIVSPEFHISTWDAGWYQIRNGLLKNNFKMEYDAFVNRYKVLENRLREGVYTFEFLRK